MIIVFDNRGGMPVTYNDVEHGGIGASERALHEVSKYMSLMGHQVYVLMNMERSMRITPNLFWGSKTYTPEGLKADVVVDFRRLYAHKQNREYKLVFWSTDDIDTTLLKNFDVYARTEKPEAYITLSNYHTRQLVKHSKGVIDESQVQAIGLGCDTPLKPTQKEKIAVFMSAPYKGLHVLAKLWPRIQKENPEWKLCVGGTMRLHKNAQHDTFMERIYKDLREQGATVQLYNRQELQELLQKASVMLYPNTYPETYGAAIYEAWANGLAVVTNPIGALPEILPDAVFCDMDVKTEQGATQFIENANFVMKSEKNRYAYTRSDSETIRTWRTVGHEMNKALEKISRQTQ